VSAFLLLLLGQVLATGGGWRAILEGSCCYVLAGMAMLAAAVLLGLERRAAAWVYGGVVLATVGVAIGIGFAFVPHGVTQLATPGQAQTTDNASVTRVPTGASSANAPAHGDWTA
jgi:quinoprotein glucose dehydrogenase